jgi:phage shock protein PspC (stress-responsive transcriptional regulator)
MTETTSHSAPQARRLERSRSDRKIAGVAGGLAQYFDLDPIIFRIGFIILTVLGGSGLLVYVAGWLILPEEGKDESIAAEVLRNRREKPWALIGLGLLALAGLILLGSNDFWPSGDGVWIVLAVVGAIILWRQRRADRGKRRTLRVFLGVLAALIVAAVASASVAIAAIGNLGDGVGDRTYRVSSPADLSQTYKLGIGTLEVDLSHAQLPAGSTPLRLKAGFARIHLIVPKDAVVAYRAKGDLADLKVLGQERNGWKVVTAGRDAPLTAAGGPVLVVDANVGAGEIDIDRATG